MSPTLPYVNAFAFHMEAKLDANRDKGDRAGWSKETPLWLLGRVNDELGELANALDMLERSPAGPHREVCQRSVIAECADVANFAMMIADVAGKMKPETP